MIQRNIKLFGLIVFFVEYWNDKNFIKVVWVDIYIKILLKNKKNDNTKSSTFTQKQINKQNQKTKNKKQNKEKLFT